MSLYSGGQYRCPQELGDDWTLVLNSWEFPLVGDELAPPLESQRGRFRAVGFKEWPPSDCSFEPPSFTTCCLLAWLELLRGEVGRSVVPSQDCSRLMLAVGWKKVGGPMAESSVEEPGLKIRKLSRKKN